jgi:outer membrane protein OmpA-like peptidoglycan-associated protein
MGNGKVRAGGLNRKSWRTVAALVGLVALGGCSTLDAVNPINWFRDSKNDPGADAPNSANLEAGSQQDYPNLASVPPTPTRGLTQAERDALAEGLVADRQNAHYADLQQRAGNAGAVPGPQAKLPEEQLQPIDLNNVQQQAQAQAAQPRPEPPRPIAPLPPVAPPAPLPPVAQAPKVTSVAPVAASGSSHLSVGGGFAAPIAASREASLKAPTPREEPQAETPTEPPPAPTLPPVPPPEPVQPLVQGHAAPDSSSADVGGVPVPPAAPVRAEPTPAAPQIAAAPTVAPQAAPLVPGKRQNSVSAAEIDFEPLSNGLPADAAAKLKGVSAQLQGHDGAIVRIVGHAAPVAGAGDALASYQTALARANAVKQALVSAGVDGAKIQTEAAPSQAGGTDRADVLVEY